MNKIQKLFLTIVSLLVTTIVLAENYNITIKTPSYGKLSLEESSDVTSGTHICQARRWLLLGRNHYRICNGFGSRRRS